MLFFMPNCVPMRTDGILKGLNGFWLAALLTLFYKTKAFIALC